jgi:cytokinin dehydrogenase
MALLDIPRLRGRLSTDSAGLAAVSIDFGGIRRLPPLAVLQPNAVRDIVAMVDYARKHRLKISARGQGYSTFGQSLAEGGIVIELASLDPSPRLIGNRLTIGAGATWRDVLKATLPHGKRPAVLPSYLGLTVGGTLSVGGIGGESHRHGAVVDQVLEIQAVTGDGVLVTCSAERNADLFDALLAGLGQCGIVVRATLKLIPAQPRASAYRLQYPDLQSMLVDARFLASVERCGKVIAYALPGSSGQWNYVLEAACFHGASSRPDPEELLAGLHPLAIQESVRRMSYFKYADRLQAKIDMMMSGNDFVPQPWLDVFLPDSRIGEFAGKILAALTPEDMGPHWPILIYPLKARSFHRRALRIPGTDAFWLIDVLSSARNAAAARKMLARNRKIFEFARNLGGKHYPISALALDREDWKRHFHPHWGWFSRAKRRFDPDNVLNPGPGIFA